MSDRLDVLAEQIAQRLAARPDPEKHAHFMRAIGAGGGAPGVIHQRGDKPLMLTDMCRGWVERDVSYHLRWREKSTQLQQVGFPCSPQGFLIPLLPSFFPEGAVQLGLDLQKEMEFTCDPSEFAATLKKFPDFSRETFGLQKKDLEVGTDALGGLLIPMTQAPRVIDFLRGRSCLIQAGAQELPLPPTGNISYPRLGSDPTFAYTDPDTTTDANTSTPDFGSVRLIARSLRGFCTIPNDLLRYSAPSAELVIRAALGGGAAVAEDAQCLEGIGSSIAPKGLMTYDLSDAETPTAGKVTFHVARTVGADGDTLEPEDIALIQSLYEESRDPDSATAWIMRPTFYATIANRRADSVAAGDARGMFLFPMVRDQVASTEKGLAGILAVTSVQLSRSDTKGTGTSLHKVIYGNFRRMLLGRSGVMELAASEHLKFAQDKTVLRAILRSDMGLEHEQSFVVTRNLRQA